MDDIDRDLKGYSPIDHFDNAYISEGWDNVKNRLAAFKADNTDLDSFFHATHAIADFYAHTSYVYFRMGADPQSTPVNDPNTGLNFIPSYNQDPSNLDSDRFSFNTQNWKGGAGTRSTAWAAKLISGRYAQNGDTQPVLINQLIEGRTNIPQKFLDAPDFFNRGALPHHNEIAVYDETFDPKKHKLFNAEEYARQFAARKSCAIRHVHNAFFDNWAKRS